MQNSKSLKELLVLALAVFNNEKFLKVNVVYATEDGNIFVEENRAKLHVKGKEQKYQTITRTEAGADQSADSNEIDEDLVAEKTRELEGLELVTANYQKMKALVLFFDIETSDMKSETLIAALTEYKNKISA